jgi:hypothetical protein
MNEELNARLTEPSSTFRLFSAKVTNLTVSFRFDDDAVCCALVIETGKNSWKVNI